MGWFDSKNDDKKHVAPKGRDPRPKGAQKGVAKRDHQKGPLNFGGKARTPWWGR